MTVDVVWSPAYSGGHALRFAYPPPFRSVPFSVGANVADKKRATRLPLRSAKRSPWNMSCLLVMLCPFSVTAQPITQIPLKPASATLHAEFVSVTSVREIADGRVIVTDGSDRTLYLADFVKNSATVLGRKGKGPKEWMGIDHVHQLPGDSSIMADYTNRRWLLLSGAKIVGTVPPDHPGVRANGTVIHAIDRFGHLLVLTSKPYRNGVTDITRADSNPLLLMDRNTGRKDTITQLRDRPRRLTVELDSLGEAKKLMPTSTEPNAQIEFGHLFYDGWLAVVRLEPLRVDWRSPTGRWTRGAPLPLKPIPVDASERQAIEKRRADFREQYQKIGFPPPPTLPMPSTLPPNTEVTRASSDGRLLLQLTTTVSNPGMRYLVINRAGVIDGEIQLAANDEVVGFGTKSIYISFKDDDDVQHLRRHPWP